MQSAILIAGPTASGKSAAALALAERLGGTVINADSMQVYRELSILTARPKIGDEARAPHRLYGTVPAGEAKLQIIDPPKQDQQLRVEFESDQPVNVAAALSDDADAMVDSVIAGGEAENALGMIVGQTSGRFEFSVPKGKEFQIIVGVPPSGEQAEVTLNVNSF